MSNVVQMIASSLVSSKVMDLFHINRNYELHVTTLTITLVSWFISSWHWLSLPIANVSYFTVLVIGVVIFIVVAAIAILWHYYRSSRPTTQSLTIFGHEYLNLTRYFLLYPKMMTKGNIDLGHPDNWGSPGEDNDEFTPSLHSYHSFHDTRCGVRGVLSAVMYERTQVENGSERRSHHLGVTLTLLLPSPLSVDEYFLQVCHHVRECRRNSRFVMLYHRRVSSSTHNMVKQFYSGPKLEREELYSRYILSYFSSQRDIIWKSVSNVHFHPERYEQFGQVPSCNFIFYGPPGSGKSTLGYRIAQALMRHPITMDIVALAEDKNAIYKAFNVPQIRGEEVQHHEVLYILDELDRLIDYLNEQRTKHETPVNNTDTTTPPGNTMNTPNRFVLKDFLEILQGSIPCRGRIILAMTNSLDTIKNELPSLLRFGRMTPIPIEYLNTEGMIQLFEYYFQNRPSSEFLKNIPSPYTGCTAELVHMAMNCVCDNDNVYQAQKQFEALLLSQLSAHTHMTS